MNWIESIKNYEPTCAQEVNDKGIMIKYIKEFDDVLTRNNKVAHMTSSAFVVNKKRDKVLMVHHNIYNSWSWTGGHADGDEDLLYVAEKELNEETGIRNFSHLSDKIISLDILPVYGHMKNGKFVSPHLHFNAAFLFEADENEEIVVKADENSGVSWIPVLEINSYSDEKHMKSIYFKILSRLK
jgi:8-oxo-dGTP pyrophosphatase MutT (NUDIX family)